jgi:hypothetical protein
MASAPELRKSFAQIFAVHFAKTAGEPVEPFVHNANMLGFVLFDCEDAQVYDTLTAQIEATLDIQVQPSS